jgi:hypothetical protein
MTYAVSSSRRILTRGWPSALFPHLNLIVSMLLVVATAPTQQPPCYSSNTHHCCEDAPFIRDSSHCDPAQATALSQRFSLCQLASRLSLSSRHTQLCAASLLKAGKSSFLQKRNEFLGVPSRSVFFLAFLHKRNGVPSVETAQKGILQEYEGFLQECAT